MSVKKIDNFLNKEQFNKIKNILTGNDFPFYYQDYIVQGEKENLDFFFCHTFYRNNEQTSSSFNEIILPILYQVKFKTLIIKTYK